MKILTVIMRDDSALVGCGAEPFYRTVHIELSADQLAKIEPRATYEFVDKAFIEDAHTGEKR